MTFNIEVYGGKQGLYFEGHGEAAGFVSYNEPKLQTTITRYSNKSFGPPVVTLDGKRYRVHGGIRGPLFITLGNHIKSKAA